MLRYRDGVIKEKGDLRLTRGERRAALTAAVAEAINLLEQTLRYRQLTARTRAAELGRIAKIPASEIRKQIAGIRAMRRVLAPSPP